jgi:hypothetical protein
MDVIHVASRHLVFTFHPLIRRYIVSVTEKALVNKLQINIDLQEIDWQ